MESGEVLEGDDVSSPYAIFACFLQQISFPHEIKNHFTCVINDFELVNSHALVQFMLCDENT